MIAVINVVGWLVEFLHRHWWSGKTPAVPVCWGKPFFCSESSGSTLPTCTPKWAGDQSCLSLQHGLARVLGGRHALKGATVPSVATPGRGGRTSTAQRRVLWGPGATGSGTRGNHPVLWGQQCLHYGDRQDVRRGGHLKSPMEPMASEFQEQSYCIYHSASLLLSDGLTLYTKPCQTPQLGLHVPWYLSPHTRWGLRALSLPQIAHHLSSGKEAPGIRHNSTLTWSCGQPSLWREANVLFHCI